MHHQVRQHSALCLRHHAPHSTTHRTDLRLRPARVERPGRHVPPRAFSHQRPHKQLSHASLDWSRHATARKNSNGLFDPPCYCLERLPCQNPGCYRPCAFWLRGLTRGSPHAKASLLPRPSLPCERVQHGCASFNCAASFCGSSTSADVRYARTLTLSDNAHASERVTRSRMLETFQDENLLTPQASHLIPTSRLHSGYIISSHQSDLPVRTHICLASPPTCLLSSLDTLSAFQANPPYPTLQATLHQRTQGYRQICLCAHVSDPPPCLPSHSQSYPEPARTRFPPANDGEIY